jgi:diguanylate cyclase (GGDEF)-like protein
MQPTSQSDKPTQTFCMLTSAAAIAVVGWSVFAFPVGLLTIGVIGVSLVTVIFGSMLRVPLPGTSTHLTLADAAVFFAMLTFGPELAILIAACEAAVSSLMMKRKGVTMRTQTIIVNSAIAAISTTFTAYVGVFVFGIPGVADLSLAHFAGMLLVLGLAQFFIHSAFISVYFSLRSGERVWKVWNEQCFDALVAYMATAVIGGLMSFSLYKVDMLLLASVGLFFGVVYITYTRFSATVRNSFAKAEQAERDRAIQAEQHISELEHYIQQLEVSSRALRESHEKLHRTVFFDGLTGLPNRNFFIDEINKRIVARKESADEFAVIFLDVNRFKTINDSLGYSIGDEMLRIVARRLSSYNAETCFVGRFGGDEFAVVVDGVKTENDATAVADWIRSAVGQPYALLGRQVFATASMGIALSNDRYSDAEEILRDADIAMHNAKETEQAYVVFDQIMHARAVSLLELETDLRLAIERSEFELYYQPIVNLHDTSIVGFEALIRWNHPNRGLITPFEFIETAESTGLIIPMTLHVLRMACTQLMLWRQARLATRSMMMSVNLSARHLSEPNVVEQLTQIFEETGCDPCSIKLEITESAVMGNAEGAIEVLRKIQRIGVQLSIDDFGTGYSNLSYLHRFPIDTLKVDRSFVSTMEDGSDNGEIVRTVIELARALRLNVIAEGIESVHQFHQLRVLGCQYGQGYFFSRPVPSWEAGVLLEDQGRWKNFLPAADIAAVPPDHEYTHLRPQ